MWNEFLFLWKFKIWGKLKFEYFIYIIIMALTFTPAINLMLILVGITPKEGVDNLELVGHNSWIQLILLACIIAPLLEEIIFRGILYSLLQKNSKFFKYRYMIISALFALYHLNVMQGMYAFLYSMILIGVMEDLSSLLAAIFLHMLANIVALVGSKPLSLLINSFHGFYSILLWLIVFLLLGIGYFFMLKLSKER